MKNKMLEYNGYYASINISLEDNCLFGKVEFINDSIVFGADNLTELTENFHAAIDEYLEFCDEVGKNPDKTLTGSFNVRIGEGLHKKAFIKAKTENVTLNEIIKKSVEQYVGTTTEIHNHVSVNIHNTEENSVKTQSFTTAKFNDPAEFYTWAPKAETSDASH